VAKYQKQSGFSLMEVLVSLAVILILIGALVGTASHIRTRANVDLTKSMLEVLSAALEQYYADQTPNAFPFDTPDSPPPNDNGFLGDDYIAASLIGDIDPANPNPANITVIAPGVLPDHTSADTGLDSVSSASSAALFYFLDKDPASRSVASAVSNTLITNKDTSGANITFTFTVGGTIDLPRYIDPWGTSIRYVYLDGTAFPVLTSAGPDRIFDTPDDITSK
jgi:prepilin-type N-terminal cleavage/methylation domain-containing protein